MAGGFEKWHKKVMAKICKAPYPIPMFQQIALLLTSLAMQYMHGDVHIDQQPALPMYGRIDRRTDGRTTSLQKNRRSLWIHESVLIDLTSANGSLTQVHFKTDRWVRFILCIYKLRVARFEEDSALIFQNFPNLQSI